MYPGKSVASWGSEPIEPRVAGMRSRNVGPGRDGE